MRGWARGGRWFWVGILLCLAGYAAALVACGLWPRSGHADLAVVLGSKVLADGRPSPRLVARLDEAVRAYQAGLVPVILVSGGREKNGFDEADVMRSYLLARDVPAQAVLEDHQGLTTWASAVNTAALMRQNGSRTVLVVSQYFHLPRCELAFHRAGIVAVFAAYPQYLEWRDVYAVAREMVALPAYALRH